MLSQEEILSTIKAMVKEELPDAKVYLFGSRATGKVHEESDWDILIITSVKTNENLQNLIHSKLFPLSVEIGSFIHFHLVNEIEWNKNPRYYVLRHSIINEIIPV